MPINIPSDLPAAKELAEENIFIMTEDRALQQDIRPLKIAIVNLMPTKIATETHLLRLLGNTPLQIDITLVRTASHISKNTCSHHLERFYTCFSEIKDQFFDGMIITGAPVEQMDFTEVDYWDELCQIMEFSKKNVFFTLHICWGAQAALHYHYGVPKQQLEKKLFGVFPHKVTHEFIPLFRGFDDIFYMPQSRHTTFTHEDINNVECLHVLADSESAGVGVLASSRYRQFFVTGHFEYDAHTLALEYARDLAKGMDIAMPENYFEDNDPTKSPQIKWKAHANLFFSNWLNYYVYQNTPFNLDQLLSYK